MKPRLPHWLRGHHFALLACVVFLVWANIETPMWADDYCRAVDPNIGDALAAAWVDYFHWTGRFFTTAITYVVMANGWATSMIPFDVLNALIFVGLVALVVRLAAFAAPPTGTGERPRLADFADALFAALLIWWAPRGISEAALWKTGSIGYLWAVAGEFLILERALALMLRGTVPPRLWLAVPFAFVMATFLEPLSVVLSLALGVLAVQAWSRGRPAHWLLSVAVAHGAGTIVLLGAPGNFARAAAVAPLVGSSPLADRISGIYANMGKLVGGYTLGALALTVAAILVREHWLRLLGSRLGLAPAPAEGRPAPHLILALRTLRAGGGWLFLVLALLYMLTLLALPRRLIEPRLTFPASVLVTCYVMSLFRCRPITPARNAALAIIIAALALPGTLIVVHDLRAIATTDRAWAQTLATAAPGSDVMLPLIRVGRNTAESRKHLFYEGFTPDPGHWINRCYARAWGVASITGQ
jgi:hypothetical protein